MRLRRTEIRTAVVIIALFILTGRVKVFLYSIRVEYDISYLKFKRLVKIK